MRIFSVLVCATALCGCGTMNVITEETHVYGKNAGVGIASELSNISVLAPILGEPDEGHLDRSLSVEEKGSSIQGHGSKVKHSARYSSNSEATWYIPW